jgi:predicted molibdopterin-dependent oxidoreductase YjgC
MTSEPFLRIASSHQDRQSLEPGAAIVLQINGRPATAHPGETVAAVLLAEGIRTFRHTPGRHEPRGLFCGIGICYECLVTVNGAANVRACVTVVAAGMAIETGRVGQHDRTG